MSMIICRYCGKHIDTDFEAEHEDECREENCKTCNGTGKVLMGRFDEMEEVDCPDCKLEE